jgi:enoyl-CoA hydratase/carnithine racemase
VPSQGPAGQARATDRNALARNGGVALVSENVLFDHAAGVAVITISRPRVRNAIDRPTADEIASALDQLDQRDEIRVGVITGADGVFCAGMDLKALAATGERPISRTRGAFGIVEQPPSKPLIAAVEGPALGGGFELALACDAVVAAHDSTFGLPEVRRGLIAAAGGVLRLPRRIPRNVAMELVITGEPISAQRAHELGLVNHLAAPGAALRVAEDMARLVAGNAPLAVIMAKRIIDESQDWPAGEAFARQAPLVQAIRESEDACEGARAFVEKRVPIWRGR